MKIKEYKTCDKCCYDILDGEGDIMEHECIENKKNKFYSWNINYDNENEIIIYKQEKEDENSYNCISHIVEQLLEENNNYTFHLN